MLQVRNISFMLFSSQMAGKKIMINLNNFAQILDVRCMKEAKQHI